MPPRYDNNWAIFYADFARRHRGEYRSRGEIQRAAADAYRRLQPPEQKESRVEEEKKREEKNARAAEAERKVAELGDRDERQQRLRVGDVLIPHGGTVVERKIEAYERAEAERKRNATPPLSNEQKALSAAQIWEAYVHSIFVRRPDFSYANAIANARSTRPDLYEAAETETANAARQNAENPQRQFTTERAQRMGQQPESFAQHPERKNPQMAAERKQVRDAAIARIRAQRLNPPERKREERKQSDTKVDPEAKTKLLKTIQVWIRLKERDTNDISYFGDTIYEFSEASALDSMALKYALQDTAIAEWYGIQNSAFTLRDQMAIINWWKIHLSTPIGMHYLALWNQVLVGISINIDLLTQIIWKSPIQGPKLEREILQEIQLNIEQLTKATSKEKQYILLLFDILKTVLNSAYALIPREEEEQNDLQKIIYKLNTPRNGLRVETTTRVDLTLVHDAIIQYQFARPVVAFVKDLLQSITFRDLTTNDKIPFLRLSSFQTNVFRKDLWKSNQTRAIGAQWFKLWDSLCRANNPSTNYYCWKMWTASDPQERYIKRLWLRANDSPAQVDALSRLIARESSGEVKEEQEAGLVASILIPESRDPIAGKRWIDNTVVALRELREQKVVRDPQVITSVFQFLLRQFIHPEIIIEEREKALFQKAEEIVTNMDPRNYAAFQQEIETDFLKVDVVTFDRLPLLVLNGLVPSLFTTRLPVANFLPKDKSELAEGLQDVLSDIVLDIVRSGRQEETTQFSDWFSDHTKEEQIVIAQAIIAMTRAFGTTLSVPSKAFVAYVKSLDESWQSLLGRPRNMAIDSKVELPLTHPFKEYLNGYITQLLHQRQREVVLNLFNPPLPLGVSIELTWNEFRINQEVLKGRQQWRDAALVMWVASFGPHTTPAEIKEELTAEGYDVPHVTAAQVMFTQIRQRRREAEAIRLAKIDRDQKEKQMDGASLQQLTDEETKTCARVITQCSNLLLDETKNISKDCQGYCQRQLTEWLPKWLKDEAPLHFSLSAPGGSTTIQVPVIKRMLNVRMQGKKGSELYFHVEGYTSGVWNLQGTGVDILLPKNSLLSWTDDQLVQFLSEKLIPSMKTGGIWFEFSYQWRDALRALPISFLKQAKLDNVFEMGTASKFPGRPQVLTVDDQQVGFRSIDAKGQIVSPNENQNMTFTIKVYSDHFNRWEPFIVVDQLYQFIWKPTNIPPVLPSYDVATCQNDIDVITQRAPDEYLTNSSVTFRIFVGGSKYEPLPPKPIIYCMNAMALMDYWKTDAKSEHPEGHFIWGQCDTDDAADIHGIIAQRTEIRTQQCDPFYKLPTHIGDIHVTTEGRRLILAVLKQYGGGFTFDLLPVTQIVQGRKNVGEGGHYEGEAPTAWVTIYDVKWRK